MDPQAEVRARLRQKEAQSGRGERRPVQPRGALKSEKNDDAAKAFEEERKAWREKNAAKLASNSDSVGRGEEDDQIQKGRDLQQANRDSLAKSLLMAKQSLDVGQETIMKMTSQREQMRKMDDDLDKANESLNRSERVIRGMKSTFGGIANFFSKPKEHHSHKLDKNIKVAEDPEAASTSDSSRPRKNGTETGEEGEEENKHIPLRDRDLANESIKSREALQEFQKGFDQEDEQLDELGEMLTQLKGQAKDMNTELKQQSVLVDHLGGQVDATHGRIKAADSGVKEIN